MNQGGKEKWGPGGNELEYGYGIDEKGNFRLCRLRIVPLLAVLTKFE